MGPKIARHGVLLSSKAASGDLFQDANRLWKEGRFVEAEKAYLAILEEKPDSAWALYRLGEARQRNGDGEGADALFERAIALNPALAQGHASTTFWRRFKFANELLEQRNLIGAERIFRDLLALDADCAPVLAKLGRIEGEHGRIQEALACYERAIAADGDYVWGPIGKAEMLDAAGDLEAAASILEAVLQRDPTMNLAQDRLQALRRRQRMNAQGVRIRHWPANVPRDTAVHGPRVAVVSWCLAHNPVGRAMILADVTKSHAACEIVGPIFPAYGEDLWPPLRDGGCDFDIRGFLAPSFAAFMEGAIRLVVERPCDVAWVSKPRLPSLLIGFLYKLIHGASVILDIDDDELAFVRADHALSFDEFLSDQSAADWREPYAKRWTQLAVSMIKSADAVTVCNPVLQRKFGGFLLRHARDAAPFAIARARRDAVREEFGFSASDKVVLFLGTPRRHKGVLDVAGALQELADPRAVFCIIGTVLDRELKKQLESLRGVRIALHPDQPYSRLAEMNAMADVVCILQDPLDPITQSQTPAKLTDAIATGTPILATAVPPVLDMMDGGKITAVSEGNLVEALRAVLSGADAGAAEARRTWFASELSTEVNAGRAREVIAAARRKNAPVPGDVMRLFAHIDALMPGSLPRECTRVTKGAFRDGARAGVLRAPRRGVNLVFFWKQNDSGIYGRRQDMLLERFASMPWIERILHIDAPISVDALNRLGGSSSADSQGRLVAANTVARFLGTADDSRIARRCFVHRGKETQFLGRELAGIEAFPNVVEAWLSELGMTENLLAWVCPVVRGFPEVQKRLGFSFVAADVIDDQRQWPMQPSWRRQLEQNYHDTFAVADAAFANCAPVARWLEDEGLNPTIVPNGMDVRHDAGSWETPARLGDLPRPIVGYCGSLSHRIDWDLLEALALARPDWSVVLIGEPAKDERYRQVVARPNVHALGVLPYETALRHVAAFDAAIIPHLDSALSLHMNPLKLYVYRGLGVGVVSAAIANLDERLGGVRVAATPGEFVAQLEEVIAERRARGRVYPPADAMQACSWQSRAATIWDRIEEAFEAKNKAGRAA
ncbi:MAG TPA: tetratricopeptide repeat-containing glycosyltransferase family protein [Rhizomicrobium sp.]|jgi:glycosyltransferase involved in cell wall biosynthesis|nr:tetratricopeptide repeat-containing glycosyltransferase family protein [Rhizomicrobium sp.]